MELIEKNGKYYQECKLALLDAKEIGFNKFNIIKDVRSNELKYSLSDEIGETELSSSIINNFKLQHLYIISDEEIKEGDYILSKFYYEDKCVKNRAFNWILTKVREIKNGKIFSNPLSNLEGGGCSSDSSNSFKVIASTDKLLLPLFNQYSPIEYLPKIPSSFIESYIKSYNEGSTISKVLVQVVKNSKGDIADGGKYHFLKLNENTVIIEKKEQEKTEDKVYTEEEIIFGVRKMLSSENIKFHYVREELPKFLEEAKKEIISFKTNLKK